MPAFLTGGDESTEADDIGKHLCLVQSQQSIQNSIFGLGLGFR